MPSRGPGALMLPAIVLLSIKGGVVCETQSQLYLTPPITEIEKYVSESLFVSCLSNREVDMAWYRGKDPVSNNKGRIHVEKAPGGKGLALFLEAIEFRDKGNYSCKATIDGKPVQVSFKLIVIKPIKFLDTSAVQVANVSDSVVILPCEVDGEPEPAVTWSINGKAPDGKKYKVVGDGLAVQNVTLEDDGDYNCRAFQLSNDRSKIIERAIKLKVQHKPIWNGSEASAYGFVSGVVNLTCEVKAEPLPKFEWKKADKSLTPQKNYTIFDEKHKSILQLQVTDEKVFGDYKCKASNLLGKMEHKISLKKGTKPKKPVISSYDSSHLSISINIKEPEDEEEEMKIIGYKFQYLVDESVSRRWENAKVKEFHKETSPYSISGLLQNTNYVVRVAARNAAGYSDFTDELSITTDKVQADSVTGSTNSANFLFSEASQLLAVMALHNIILLSGDLLHLL